MKKVVLLLLLTVITLTSCKKDATDVTFSTNLSKTSDQIDVNSPTMKASSAFNETFIVDLSNADTQDYIDRIKDIDLENVRISFQGLAGLAGNTTSTILRITVNDQITLTFNNFVYDNVANGQDFVIDDAQKVNEMADLLKSAKKLTIKVEGNIPDTAMYQFYINFMAKANITASAL